MFKIASKLSGDFLIAYDYTQEIRNLVKAYNFEVANVAMKNTVMQK